MRVAGAPQSPTQNHKKWLFTASIEQPEEASRHPSFYEPFHTHLRSLTNSPISIDTLSTNIVFTSICQDARSVMEAYRDARIVVDGVLSFLNLGEGVGTELEVSILDIPHEKAPPQLTLVP